MSKQPPHLTNAAKQPPSTNTTKQPPQNASPQPPLKFRSWPPLTLKPSLVEDIYVRLRAVFNSVCLAEKVLGRRFVVTETLRFHLQELALAVSEGKAVVLEGT